MHEGKIIEGDRVFLSWPFVDGWGCVCSYKWTPASIVLHTKPADPSVERGGVHQVVDAMMLQYTPSKIYWGSPEKHQYMLKGEYML